MTPARMQKPMTLTIRVATRADVPAIVRMLSDDILGAKREAYADPLPQAYYDAFAEVEAMTGTEQIVAERDGVIIGSMQLSYIPRISKVDRKSFVVGKSVTVREDLGGVRSITKNNKTPLENDHTIVYIIAHN